MPYTPRQRLALPVATCAVVALTVSGAALSPAYAQEEAEQIVNGDFSEGTLGWWSTENLTMAVDDGQLCTDVPGGTANAWDAIIGQNDVPLVAGESYTFRFTASASDALVIRAVIQLNAEPWPTVLDQSPVLGTEPQTFEYTFTATDDWADGQVAFQIGRHAQDWRLCLDDVSLRGGAEPPVYEPDTGPRVRVNQVGYLPYGPKQATLVTEATEPLPWTVRDAGGIAVATGQTVPFGVDDSSGQNVHTIDFGEVTAAGTGYTLEADGETSHPFDLSGDAYQRLRTDALSFYYTQRSGIEIDDAIAPGYGRPAGHAGVAPNQGDTEVTCFAEGCDYTLDASGGWYDAGDHGKYVVNGGISVYQLMSLYERTKYAATADAAALGDGTLRIPEHGNGVPDVLDEARWEMEFLLGMQVPAGQPLAGMAHHKVHDELWTGLPLLPHNDPQARFLHPPSTAATLNLAATAAQCARLFAPYDTAFAQRCLSAARTAWDAAIANPDRFAAPGGEGGGPYDDTDVSDEFYWAAAELFLTTAEQRYADAVQASPLHAADVFSPYGFGWQSTAALARLDLATIPNGLSDRDQVRDSVVDAAEGYLATLLEHPYGVAYNPPQGNYVWGSNSQVLNNLVVLGSAFDINGDTRFRDGVLEGLDYILGRNALNQSYVTAYGENNAHNQHSRWYSNQLDPSLPNPPPGSLAGGPNSETGTWDPVAQANLSGCPPQWCYIDDIGSWATNELTINWNSTLSWVASFAADQGDGTPAETADCEIRYVQRGDWPGGFNVQITINNTGDEPLRDWRLQWSFLAGQRIAHHWGMDAIQDGATVTASSLSWNSRIAPGRQVSFGFIGRQWLGANPVPELFTFNGLPCVARAAP